MLTVAEEQGLRGAKAFDASQLRSQCGFVLDHAGPVGEVIVTSPTQQKIPPTSPGSRRMRGSGPRTEQRDRRRRRCGLADGAGAARRETTANVGVISGGTSGNVVPGHC